MPDDMRETLKSSKISDQTHASLTDAEDRIFCCHSDITGTEQVNPSPYTMAGDCGDDRLATSFYGVHTLLTLEDRFSQLLPCICADPSSEQRSKLHQVKPRRHTLPFRLDHSPTDTRAFTN